MLWPKKILYTEYDGEYILYSKGRSYVLMMTTRKIPIILTIVLTFMSYGLPSGFHLRFCFGEDGHWDVAAVVCTSNQQDVIPKSLDTDPSGHHMECHDVSTGCNAKSVCPSNPSFLNHKTSQKVLQLTSVSEASGIMDFSPPKTCGFSSSSEPSFFIPSYMQTMVFLI